MNKFKIAIIIALMIGVGFICGNTCSENGVEPNSISSSSNIRPEDKELSDAIYMMNLYGTKEGLDRGDGKRTRNKDEKNFVLGRSAYIKGDTVQLLRYFCWVIETDASIRKMFMDQWLSEYREEEKLPALEVVIQKINQTIPFYGKKEIKVRDKEIKEVYSSLKKKNIKKRNDTDVEWGAYIAKGLKPLVDSCQPMGSVLFCGDKKRINEAYQKCLVARGEIKSVDYKIIPLININQHSCDLVLECLIYNIKTLRNM